MWFQGSEGAKGKLLQGRRSADDERQIGRWARCAGDMGRWCPDLFGSGCNACLAASKCAYSLINQFGVCPAASDKPLTVCGMMNISL